MNGDSGINGLPNAERLTAGMIAGFIAVGAKATIAFLESNSPPGIGFPMGLKLPKKLAASFCGGRTLAIPFLPLGLTQAS